MDSNEEVFSKVFKTRTDACIQKPSFPTHFSKEGEDVKIRLFTSGESQDDPVLSRLAPLQSYYGNRIEIEQLGTRIRVTIRERVASRKDIDAAAERLRERFSEHTGLTAIIW